MALPDIIPVEDLFAPPQRAGASISPDGTRLAFLAPWKGRLNVWVQDLPVGSGTVGGTGGGTDGGIDADADLDAEPRCVTADETRSVLSFRWTDDPRWLLYTQDEGGNENFHLFRVDLDDPDAPVVDLTPFPGARVISFELPPERPGTALLQLNARTPAQFDLLELDLATGELTTVAENPGHVMGWVRAGDDAVFAQTVTANGDSVLTRWPGAAGPVATFDGADHPMGVAPFEVTPDGGGVWLGSLRGSDRVRLVRLDLGTGEETEVDSHPTFDLDTRSMVFPTLPSPLIRHRRTGELLGARYLGERQVIRALDPTFAAVLENLEALSDGDLADISSDVDGRRWVVSFTHDRDPGATWLYDHATGERRLLFRPYPHLDPAALAPMHPVTTTARDGLRLPSYLTLPVGVEASGLPTVLMVHGGPWTRDGWGFNKAVQMLANRGYAVLQVNFRGSTGFGKAHMQAAVGEFAGAMHDDLIDAVDWAVDQGFTDPDRVAIFGGSYGGYATLVGVTFTPDRFAAAVDYVGISNLANFMRTVPEFAKPGLAANWFHYVGDPSDPAQEADMLARSPISRIDEIRTPLMVVQGANDTRVVQAESDNVVAGLRERGLDVEYLVFDDEGHQFVNPENLIAMFGAAERFVGRHLGVARR